jgi:hypothetical protein
MKITQDFYCLLTSQLNDLFSLKTDVNVSTVKTKTRKKIIFVGILRAAAKKSRIRIRIRIKMSQIRNGCILGLACLWQRRRAVPGRRWWPSPASLAPLRSLTRAGPSHLVLKTELDVVRSPLRIRYVWGSRQLEVHTSVSNPDPSDANVFRPPGSGSGGPDPSIIKQK